MRLSTFKILSFDCYGTLIDWESGLIQGLLPLTGRLRPPLDRDMILEAFARQETAQEAMTPTKPYRDVLAIVYRRLAESWNLSVAWDDCVAFGEGIAKWPAFPDSATALTILKRHFKLVILSNVDNRSFAASNARLGVAFDAVYTADDIGSYKPDPRNFTVMLDRLAERGFVKTDILHVAQSLYHDHVPAAELGLARCWIDRRSRRTGSGATLVPSSAPTPDFRFDSLASLVAALGAEGVGAGS